MANKFNVQVKDSEVADPCIGVSFSVAENADGAIPAGTYQIKGEIEITDEGSNDSSISHPFPSGNAKFLIRMQATGNNPIAKSIPFNDPNYVSHGENKTAYLTVRLVDNANSEHSYTVLNRHCLTTSANFSDSRYTCPRG